MRREWPQIMANVANVRFEPKSSTSSHQHQVIGPPLQEPMREEDHLPV
jgi:hypothetical protein